VLLGRHVFPERCRDRLDDPRSITRLAGIVAEALDVFHRRHLAAAEATDDLLALERTTALKAFLLGFNATRAGAHTATAATADEYLDR
jgi:hypothetical protein